MASRKPYRLVFAASMSVSISVGVRCSRLRNSELGRREIDCSVCARWRYEFEM